MSRNRDLPKQDLRMKKPLGIVAILNPDDAGERPASAAPSIRRTLSADMSSKQWLRQNGMMMVINKSDSSAASTDSSSSDGEDDDKHGCVWMSINEMQSSGRWDSIFRCRKSDDGLPPPYVHPAAKRSASGLSEKSLEVCTESLGSESGSDCFGLDPDEEGDKFGFTIGEEDEKLGFRIGGEDRGNRFAESNARKYKESPPARPFPPPIQSIAGGALRIHSRRRDGRLVLEAVTVPPKRIFHAERGAGRLILRLINSPSDGENNEFAAAFDVTEETGEEANGAGWKPRPLPLPLLPAEKKLRRRNPQFSEELEFPAPESLTPPQPRMSPPAVAIASLNNAYHYFWRNNTAVCGGLIATVHLRTRNPNYHNKGNNGNHRHHEKMVKTGEEYAFGDMRGCKETRRSVSIWEPHCIATS